MSVSQRSSPEEAGDSNSTLRSVVSLMLVIHLLCVAVVLGSNLRRSPLQSRLVATFAVYTQLLHFDPDFVPYHYTSGLPGDDQASVVVDLYPDANTRVEEQTLLSSVALPEEGGTWRLDRQRSLSLARMLSLQAEAQNDDAASEIAGAVGIRLLRVHNRAHPPESQAHWAVVRCRRHIAPPLIGVATTTEAVALDVYTADVRLLEGGELSVTRREAARDAAPVRTPSSAPASP
jgi:hypothetical protein